MYTVYDSKCNDAIILHTTLLSREDSKTSGFLQIQV